MAGWRLGGAPGARRGGGQGLPLPRLRSGGLPGHRARRGLADARRRRRPAALAYRVLAAAHAAPPRLNTPRGLMAQLIRAATVLPARRTPITFTTEDGLNLVGELALPQDRDPAATLVCLHPLPTQGGMMDSHVMRKASYRLPALADVAGLRFHMRGTCRGEGGFGGGGNEPYDVAAAVRYVADAGLPNIWLLGWSVGTELTLRWGLL